MFTRTIEFRDGYRYQLKRDYAVMTPIRSESGPVGNQFVSLKGDGALFLTSGYAWDGPSGPTVDTPSFMRASLVHDGLYQLMREGHLPRDPYRELADRLLRAQCIEDGMSPVRAWWVYQAVRMHGEGATYPVNQKPLRTAP